jgi:hypothetical protein
MPQWNPNIIQRSIVFTKPQMAWLKKEAKRLDVTIAEVIRRIIDQYRETSK